jgi:hypothetical protein
MSALRTVVLPRGQPVRVSRFVFGGVRRVFDLRAKVADDYSQRDRIMAIYAPVSLVSLAAVWLGAVILGFAAMFWASGSRTFRDALAVSGSSVTTLGFDHPPNFFDSGLAVVEAAIGLGLVALLISYLPSIYSSFQRRELQVALLATRAGDPPSALKLLRRHHRIGSLDRLAPLFAEWEVWFADIEETHTTLSALCFFRSPVPGRSWVTAAGAVLDTAALVQAVVDGETRPEPSLCIRAGYLSLRRIADAFDIPYDADPNPDDPISIDRSEFDALCAELEAIGVSLAADREEAWAAFAGWRVNYDQVLIALAGLTMAPYAPWSSDRSLNYRTRPLKGGSRLAPPDREND